MYGTGWPVDHDGRRLSASHFGHLVAHLSYLGFLMESNAFYSLRLGHVKRNQKEKKTQSSRVNFSRTG